jgi:hypothetical protein
MWQTRTGGDFEPAYTLTGAKDDAWLIDFGRVLVRPGRMVRSWTIRAVCGD